MARIGGKFFRGTLGQLVYRVINGVQIVSTKPSPGLANQTPETLRNCNTFGMASGLGADIRKLFAPFLNGLTDPLMHNRVSKSGIGTSPKQGSGYEAF